MGKYLKSKLNDLAELYLLIENIELSNFEGYKYMLWNNKKRQKYANENNIKQVFTGGYIIDNEDYIKWLITLEAYEPLHSAAEQLWLIRLVAMAYTLC